MKNGKKLICVMLVLSVVLAALLSGCSCIHKWEEATCVTPKTCSRCGETEGGLAKHTWEDTSCVSPTPCSVCGTLEGIPLTHQWREDCKICVLCGADERPADIRFAENLVKGLEDRWALENANGESGTVSAEVWEQYLNAEYDRLAELREEPFDNEALGEWAVSYIDCLADAKELLPEYGTTVWEDQYTNGIYHQSTVALYKINAISPIVVAEEYQETLQAMLDNGQAIDMVNELFDQAKFQVIATSGGVDTYEAIVENTTTLNFTFFSFEVELLDENGEIITTETVSVNNWEAGEKEKFRFSTKELFAEMEVKYANWIL